jgi:hypothetical protein
MKLEKRKRDRKWGKRRRESKWDEEVVENNDRNKII